MGKPIKETIIPQRIRGEKKNKIKDSPNTLPNSKLNTGYIGNSFICNCRRIWARPATVASPPASAEPSLMWCSHCGDREGGAQLCLPVTLSPPAAGHLLLSTPQHPAKAQNRTVFQQPAYLQKAKTHVSKCG